MCKGLEARRGSWSFKGLESCSEAGGGGVVKEAMVCRAARQAFLC